MVFGDLIKERRRELGLSLTKLSEKTGGDVTPSYINRLENNKKLKPSFDVVCVLMASLSLEIEDVFKSFGYSDLLSSKLSGEDLLLTVDGEDYAVEVKTNIKRVDQQTILQRINQEVVAYSCAKPGKELGHLPVVMTLIEELRKENSEKEPIA